MKRPIYHTAKEGGTYVGRGVGIRGQTVTRQVLIGDHLDSGNPLIPGVLQGFRFLKSREFRYSFSITLNFNFTK